MSKVKVFLDLDGVIFNCSKGFADKFNLELPKRTYLEYGHHEKWWNAENRAKLDHDFWANLELYPWSMDIIKTVEKYDANFRFLTACISHEGCYSGKYKAVKDKLGSEYTEKIITSYRDKTFAAKQNAVLIDDKQDNCVQWSEAGGISYRWEERTNDMIEDTIEELRDLDFFLKTLSK